MVIMVGLYGSYMELLDDYDPVRDSKPENLSHRFPARGSQSEDPSQRSPMRGSQPVIGDGGPGWVSTPPITSRMVITIVVKERKPGFGSSFLPAFPPFGGECIHFMICLETNVPIDK